MKRKRYPNTPAGRIAEAKAAIARLQYTLSQGDNRLASMAETAVMQSHAGKR